MTLEDIYLIYKQFPIITTDSRNCPHNSIFIALKGENFNGNRFAQAALDKGCAYAVVDEVEFAGNERIILVENTLETLQDLARLHRQKLNTPIIGITGSNGKTTTKELIYNVLKQKYNVLYTQGNLNNHIGVPLTLLSLTEEHKMAVIEMGANHPGEIKILSEIALPNYGIITNVGKAHLEGFGSFENIIKTKGELYDYIRATGGTIFINAENPYLMKISNSLNKVKYSLTKKEFVTGHIENNSPTLALSWTKENDEQTYYVKSNLIGTYNAENIMAAICIGTYFDIEPKKINEALENYVPQNNRSQLTKTEHNTLIIDSYNANPTSMEAAIRNFEEMKVEGKILILGDMYELGEDSQKEHQKIVHLLEKCRFDYVFLIGKNFAATYTYFYTFADMESFKTYLQENEFVDFHILIKGSRGMKMEQIIEFL